MKAIIAELNMYRNQVEEYKSDNNRVKKENIELQKRISAAGQNLKRIWAAGCCSSWEMMRWV